MAIGRKGGRNALGILCAKWRTDARYVVAKSFSSRNRIPMQAHGDGNLVPIILSLFVVAQSTVPVVTVTQQ